MRQSVQGLFAVLALGGGFGLAWSGEEMSLREAEPPAKSAEPEATRAVVLYSTRQDEKLHVLDAGDLSLVGSHPLGVGAHELAVSPDMRWVIGTAYGGPGAGHQPADRRVAVFDLREGKVARTIDAKPMSRPNDAAFTADSTRAYVTIEAPPRVLKVDPATGDFSAITLSRGTNHMLALAPDGKRLYVAHVVPGAVTVVDTAAEKEETTIAVPDGAEGIAVSPDGTRVWVACNRSDTIVVISAKDAKVEHEMACEGFPFRLRIAPDGKTAAVSLAKTDEVALYDTKDLTKVRRVSLREKGKETGGGLVPTSIGFTPDGTRLAVVCSGGGGGGGGGEIVLVDVAKGEIVARRKADGGIADALATARISASKP
jgi:YVTN family beta-propeller protein